MSVGSTCTENLTGTLLQWEIVKIYKNKSNKYWLGNISIWSLTLVTHSESKEGGESTSALCTKSWFMHTIFHDHPLTSEVK